MTELTAKQSSEVPTIAEPALGSATWALTALLILLLASSPAITRLAVTQSLTPYDILALRCGIGGLVLAPWFIKDFATIPRRLLWMGMVLSFCHGWGMYLTAIVGLQYAPAGHASALGPGFAPVWVALWGWLFYRLKVSGRQAVGLALIGVGALVLLWSSGTATLMPQVLLGDLLFLMSSGVAGIYLTYVQRHKVPMLQGASLVAVYSALIYLPWFIFAPVPSRLAQVPMDHLWFHAIYQGVCVGALFMVLLNFVVLRIGGQRFTIIGACGPVLALLFGRIIAGDAIRLIECVAIALVSAGVIYGATARPKADVKP